MNNQTKMNERCRQESSEAPVENLTLENVMLTAKEGLTIASAKGIKLKNVKVIPEKGEPFLLHNAEVEGLENAK